MDDRYDKYKTAQRTGGPCEVCGWRDGDGVKQCFYSSELGATTHHNTERAAIATMTPEQASLFKLRSAMVYIDEAHQLAQIELELGEKAKAENLIKEQEFQLRYPGQSFRTNGDTHPPTPMTWDDWVTKRTSRIMKDKRATDPEYVGWIQESAGAYFCNQVHIYEPHPNCGGKQIHVAPYHIKCSKCGVEVKMWEHGIDPDMG